MSKDKKIGIAVWALGLILVMVLMFCLEHGMTATFWTMFVFTCVAFVSALIFQLLTWKQINNSDQQVQYLSGIIIANMYMVLQIPLSLIFSLGSATIPFKVAILINAIILIAAWILALISLSGNEHIEKVNSRQKNHHVEL